MKKYLFLFCFFLAMNSAKAATISNFIDEYDVSNWTKIVDGGSINPNLAPSFILLTSSNDGSHNKTYQDFTISAAGSGLVSFDWAYLALDLRFSSKFDPFGWLLNGEFTKLTDNKGFPLQFGEFSASVSLGDVFGFRIISKDSFGGPAFVGISGFSAPAPAPAAVPAPAAIWMFGAGLLGLLWQSKRTKAASNIIAL
ncbi:MAG: hypothetical protein PHY16_05925 [Methylobacter sp.]|nr:hypothetical protein [Methylobacter sp.]